MKPGRTTPQERGGDKPGLTRREFLAGSALAAAATIAGCTTSPMAAGLEPVIDIHQHAGYSGRPDEVLLAHQRAMGVSKTILLPAGRNVNSASTHGGVANGLQAQCLGNEACYRLAQAHPGHYFYAANEVPDLEGAAAEIDRYLKQGALMIAEQKF